MVVPCVMTTLRLNIYSYNWILFITDKEGYSLVHWASKKDDVSIIKLLYEHGADLSLRTTCEAKMLPIHWAASDGRIAILQFLLERRQDINAHDANGCSPLIVATQHNQFGAIIFLIKNSADVTQRDSNGDCALHWAAYKGLLESLSLLVTYMPLEINRGDNFGQVSLRKCRHPWYSTSNEGFGWLENEFYARGFSRDTSEFSPTITLKVSKFKHGKVCIPCKETSSVIFENFCICIVLRLLLGLMRWTNFMLVLKWMEGSLFGSSYFRVQI